MIKYFFLVFLFLVIIIIFTSSFLSNNKKDDFVIENTKKEVIKDSLLLSQIWFDNFQTDENIITYSFSPAGNRIEEERNMVRELGSFWGYTRLYGFNRTEKTLKNIEKIRKNIAEYIKYDTIEGQDIAFIDHEDIAQVNTQAFYILALAELVKNGIELSERERDDLKKIIKSLHLMRAEEGGLWYIYYLPKEHNKISPYGTSEALFSLVNYYKYIEKDEEVLNFVKKVFSEYYEVSKKHSFIDEEARAYYSWILYFLTDLSEIDSSYYKYIEELTNKGLDYRSQNKECFDKGCLITEYASAESAFLEGGIYSYSILKENNYERIEELKDYINKAIDNLLMMQIKSIDDFNKKSGNIFNGDEKNLIGAFCPNFTNGSYNCDLIRNDVAQHSSSALLNYYNTFY